MLPLAELTRRIDGPANVHKIRRDIRWEVCMMCPMDACRPKHEHCALRARIALEARKRYWRDPAAGRERMRVLRDAMTPEQREATHRTNLRYAEQNRELIRLRERQRYLADLERRRSKRRQRYARTHGKPVKASRYNGLEYKRNSACQIKI